jgi:hypothetical protein
MPVWISIFAGEEEEEVVVVVTLFRPVSHQL